MGRSTSLLQSLLEKLDGFPEDPEAKVRVYYQPPANVVMEYPCILLERNDDDTRFANNFPYAITHGYDVTIIDGDPDNSWKEKVEALPMCTFNRHFESNNLNHDVYKLYF